jgi:hypothetical protein
MRIAHGMHNKQPAPCRLFVVSHCKEVFLREQEEEPLLKILLKLEKTVFRTNK